MENNHNTLAYSTSDRTEFQLSNEKTEVTLLFPSTLDQKLSKLMGKCLRIDHVILEYRNQVPVNATGHVIIEMHDTRLHEGDSKQAEFTIPIGCNCNIHYYSSSYFSPKDPSPWKVLYRVDDTNVVNGVHFCRMQGKLKMSSAKQSTEIQFKSPKIEILSKAFNMTNIDFWTVPHSQVSRKPVQGLTSMRSQSCRYTTPAILPGQTWASASAIGNEDQDDLPYRGLHRLQDQTLDPGPSASEVVVNNNKINDDVINIIKKTVELCMEGSNVTSNAKPIK
uniref:Movement protein BC1 n=2 Tax=Begomovirus TaxID=10814 RepID=A0A455VRB1_9GEMI|nr:movement protein [Pepper yellow leaf curl Aceh virus]QSX72109.1 BC1 protein [Pepper yellow leaf curl Indonesia virus]WLV76336.1 BC1 [Pepper yellow leaf curl Aceh virus]WLV76340.1 BC1 [Pepper yellow leaf curl Aceh virus]BBI93196.1 movement protein [Pepper yellow leaf curl Aceh virus]